MMSNDSEGKEKKQQRGGEEINGWMTGTHPEKTEASI